MVELLNPLDDKIVLFGQSCVGKTYFASLLTEHRYYCFDALFPWYEIETLGLSTTAALRNIDAVCTDYKFVLDGWHLADPRGQFLPSGAIVCVVYAPYVRIVSQFHAPLVERHELYPMFNKWYRDIDYSRFAGARFFMNVGKFVETAYEQFLNFLKIN